MPQPSSYVTKHPITIKRFYGGSAISYPDFEIPEGLRCAPNQGGSREGFWLDELPQSIFPSGSCIRHDATYYGIHISPDDVREIPGAMEPDYFTRKPLTPEDVEDYLQKQQVIYASARKNEKALVFYCYFNGGYRVSLGDETVVVTEDCQEAIDAFKRTYSA